MALGRPSIETRGEFEAELTEAIDQAEKRLRQSPSWTALQVIRRQLECMKTWTENMRTPTVEERKKINIGLIAVRELEHDEEMADLCHRLGYFFQEWPLAMGR